MPEHKGHIESAETAPTVAGHTLRAGQKFEVKVVSVKEPQLAATAKVGARLCGGTDTCLALVEV
jgi:hypothetical protein